MESVDTGQLRPTFTVPLALSRHDAIDALRAREAPGTVPDDPAEGRVGGSAVGSGRRGAVAFPAVAGGTSCNQASFKAGKRAFLYIGPGAKGQGFKAMFKLDRSMGQARELASTEPARYEVGSTGWVTTRFTAQDPLPRSIWEVWLEESYELARPSGA